MKGCIFFRAILAILPALNNSVMATQLVRSTILLSGGTVRGNPRDSTGIISFKGIPYAAPPVGDLRWAPTRPAAPWKGTLNATQFGYTCWSNLQGDGPPSEMPNNEDCLTINVWTGATDTDNLLPVMMWVHGGGFQFGSSTEPVFNGTTVAGKDVVVVNFNYRLGVFGFLGLEELDEENRSPSGNFGLQDMIMALRWVKLNIKAFGGDPDNVTVFGQSAGAHSVGLLMSSPIAQCENLFHKGIMESGAWWDRSHGSLATFDEARQYGVNFLAKLNVTSVAELRAISAEDINNANPFSLSQDPGVTGFAPSIDTYVVPKAPGRAFHNAQQMRIPLMAGFNSAEQYEFMYNELPHDTAEEFENAARILFGDRMPEFLALYPDGNSEILNDSSGALVGDLYIREQTWEAAYTHQRTTNAPVWAYYYSYSSEFEPIATHTAEIPFVFGNLLNNPAINSTMPPTDEDLKFSEVVMAYWTNFARTGNPNGEGLVTWPAYGSGGADFLQLQEYSQPYALEFLPQYNFIKSFRNDGELPLRWRNLSSVGV